MKATWMNKRMSWGSPGEAVWGEAGVQGSATTCTDPRRWPRDVLLTLMTLPAEVFQTQDDAWKNLHRSQDGVVLAFVRVSVGPWSCAGPCDSVLSLYWCFVLSGQGKRASRGICGVLGSRQPYLLVSGCGEVRGRVWRGRGRGGGDLFTRYLQVGGREGGKRRNFGAAEVIDQRKQDGKEGRGEEGEEGRKEIGRWRKGGMTPGEGDREFLPWNN